MSSVGLLFSGQGAQVVGMGSTLVKRSKLAAELYAEADAVLGWEVSKVSFEGPEAALTETRFCQPALFVHGYVVFRMLEEAGKLGEPGGAAGLSLGELTAMTAAGIFDFSTGLRLVAERGRLMQEACENTDGAMASFIGGEFSELEQICADFDIEIANLNCPGQTVVSGERTRVEAAVEVGKDRGFKLVKLLKVGGAYHSRLMETARERFAGVLEATGIGEPRFPVYANVTGARIEEPGLVRELLEAQIVGSVRFESCLRAMAAEQGLSDFIECGPGKVLAGLCRRTEKGLAVRSYAEAEDFND